MRFRTALVLTVAAMLLWIPEAFAQKRVFTTVNPNKNVFNDTADIYTANGGAITQPIEKMAMARDGATALQLRDGTVLIAGGYNNHYLRSAELYDPQNDSFSETGDMMMTRVGAASVLMPNETVLLIGGYNSNYIETMEQYDPVAKTFGLVAGRMTTPRQYASATLLDDGTVLIAGGFNGSFLISTEIYDHAQRSILATSYMKEARVGHSAVRIIDSVGEKVLIAGGCNNSNTSEIVCDRYLQSAELYNPSDGSFTLTGAMHAVRKDHTATVLPDGRVLIVGGTAGFGSVLNSAEIYNPGDGTFSLIGKTMSVPRVNHTASLLANGKVLIAGGESADGQPLASMEIYDPGDGEFYPAGDMSIARTLHTAAVLDGGARVFLVGGTNSQKFVFDVNSQVLGDNVGGDIRFSSDGSTGYVAYTGSGKIIAFSTTDGSVTAIIPTGGNPAFITPLINDRYLAVTSVLDNRIFMIDTDNDSFTTYTFRPADGFGFGSRIELSNGGAIGYISSSTTGEVIKFNVMDGVETGRYSGMHIPAQITANRDGRIIMVVDAGANIVEGINTATMRREYTFAPQDRYYPAAFTINNRVVPNADGTIALITSQDSVVVSDSYSGAFIFDPRDGTWVVYDDGNDDDEDDDEGADGIYAVGYGPGFTALTPDGNYWIVLSQNFLSLVPTVDLRDRDNKPEDEISVKNYPISGRPMGSSNVIMTPDSQYAFYASATTDQIFQMDLNTGALIGAYLVGDDPNLSPDQPISLAAMTADGSMFVAMSFVANELNLFTDSHVYRQTRYISQQDRFTGLVIVNDSPDQVKVKVSAKTNNGFDHYYYDDDSMENPVDVTISAHDMKSIDVSELFGLDNDVANEGYLVIESEQPVVVAFTAVGQIQGNFLHPYIRSMEGQSFFAMGDVSSDWIIPEIPESSDARSEINLLNPRYSTADYTLTHYGTDGTEMEVQENSIAASTRSASSVTDTATAAARSQVLIVGGFSKNKTAQNSETFDGSSLYYLTAVTTRAPRHGHAAVAMANGKVLIAGGQSNHVIHKTAELYDPSSGYFTFTPGSMNIERYRHTATRLLNGKVLLAGGQNMRSITDTAELFDFTAGSFRYTEGQMSIPRDAHTATRLGDGTVLITGGLDGVGTTNTAELYNPTDDSFSLTIGRMNSARAFHTATLLKDGRVFIAGGYNGEFLNSAEIYDPKTQAFEPVTANMEARSNHTATLLSDGTVLIAGGRNATTEETGGLNTAEVYDPTNSYFILTDNNMTFYRSYHTAVNFMDDTSGDNDRVVLSGGFGISSTSSSDDDDDDDDEVTPEALASSDIYTPGTRLFTAAYSSMSYARQGHTALLMDETVTSGYLRLKSDAGVLATESYTLEKGDAPTSISAINVAKHVGIKTIYSPRFVISSERKTLLNVINGNESSAGVTLVLHAANGTVIQKEYSLAGNAQIKGTLAEVFTDSDLTPITPSEGWIEVSSTMDQVVGVVTFTGENASYLGSFELSGTPMTKFIFPLVSEDAVDFETELTFLNPGTSAVSITLELFAADGGGSPAGTGSVSLNAGENISKKLVELFATGIPVETGYVKVTANGEIYGMGEVRALSNRFITPVPPVVR